MAMVSMKMEPEGEGEEMYPEELCLEIEGEQLAKLGVTAPMRLGTEVTITARAYVKETSATMVEGGMEPSVELQITDMSLEPVATAARAATMLYGG
jgi:hypothetical protein